MLKKTATFLFLLFFTIFSLCGIESRAQSRYGPNDTLQVPIIVYNGDTLIYKEYDAIYLAGKMSPQQREAQKKWTRLRNAVYVTYPYAIHASAVINDINSKLPQMTNEKQRKTYIKSREAELKKQFADPITALSVYQGKVLMKLINRQTKNNCYELIKEYKGGFSAHFWQTMAWLFSSSLKQEYDAKGEDAEMEEIVRDVARMYGHAY